MSPLTSYLLRSFIPSWRFYSGIISSTRLQLKLSSASGETSWFPAWPAPPRRWWNLLFNPAANLTHAKGSLLHQVEVEISALLEGGRDRFEDSTSFRLLRNLAEISAREGRGAHLPDGDDIEYQFRLESVDPISGSTELLLESKRYPLESPARAP